MKKHSFTSNYPTSTALREKLGQSGLITGIGIYDAFSALMLESAGAELLFLGGFGATASQLGLPDLSLISAPEMITAIRHITNVVQVPLIADGDTGFGCLPNLVQAVQQYEDAGAAGILLEDQTFPKRCGHFQNKSVIPSEEMERKLGIAVNARQNSDFLIIARTDALAVESFDQVVHRVQRYADAGVDMCFVEALETEKQIRELPQKVSIPLMINMLWGGRTPILSASELEELGYKLMAIPIASLLAVGGALKNLMADLQQHGKIVDCADQLISFKEIKNVLKLDSILDSLESDPKSPMSDH
ncbi:2,3-dimethylmalate lyase [Polystyrenella longa]|uniref:2,3-dimethylmalate lyase n=1 Tax=Polystyrenella longa TaxID=2528007 RepID=A0A518CP60_9PLAN|nr:oxaloacetate decarboxylase [Polystyrenella longa]QDU81005.1 2,3-dimethylmalate lyase [Polystyrenella longa]